MWRLRFDLAAFVDRTDADKRCSLCRLFSLINLLAAAAEPSRNAALSSVVPTPQPWVIVIGANRTLSAQLHPGQCHDTVGCEVLTQ